MDFVKKAMAGGDNNKGESTQGGGGGGGFMGGIGDKLNSAAGGGKESEKNEDLLDKGVCVCVLLHFLFVCFCFPLLHLPDLNATLSANLSPSLYIVCAFAVAG